MSNKYLPNESWKYSQSLYSSFNNELLSGLSQGINLYSPEKDLTLYKKTDYKPLDNVNFDKINKDIDTNDNYFNNAESTIKGGLSGTIQGIGDGLGKGLHNFLFNLLGIDIDGIKTYLGLMLIFLIIYKKI